MFPPHRKFNDLREWRIILSRVYRTHCSIHKGFSVVFRSSMICFFISASLRLVSVGIEITQFFKQQQSTIKLIAPTKSTMRRAMMAASAMSNSSWRLAVYAGMTFSMAKPCSKGKNSFIFASQWSSPGCTYAVVVLEEIILCINLVQHIEHWHDVLGLRLHRMEEQVRPVHTNATDAVDVIANVVDNDVLLRDVR